MIHNYSCPVCGKKKIHFMDKDPDDGMLLYSCKNKECRIEEFYIHFSEKISTTSLPLEQRETAHMISKTFCPSCSQEMIITHDESVDLYDENRDVQIIEALCTNSDCKISWVTLEFLVKVYREEVLTK